VALLGKFPNRDSIYTVTTYESQLKKMTAIAMKQNSTVLKTMLASAHALRILWQHDQRTAWGVTVQTYVSNADNLFGIDKELVEDIIQKRQLWLSPLEGPGKQFSQELCGIVMGALGMLLQHAQNHEMEEEILQKLTPFLERWALLLGSPGAINIMSVGHLPDLMSLFLTRSMPDIAQHVKPLSPYFGIAPELLNEIYPDPTPNPPSVYLDSTLLTTPPLPSPFVTELITLDQYLVQTQAKEGHRRLKAAAWVLEQFKQFLESSPDAEKQTQQTQLTQNLQWMRLKFGGACVTTSLFGSGKGWSILLKPVSLLISLGWSFFNQIRGLFAGHRFANHLKTLQDYLLNSSLNSTDSENVQNITDILQALDQGITTDEASTNITPAILQKYGFSPDEKSDVQTICQRWKKKPMAPE
jgi:hypothetical protein